MKEDKESNAKRFGCGFLLGLALVFSFGWGTASDDNLLGGLLFGAGVGLILGLAAMFFGKSFWYWAEKWLP